MDAGLLRHRVTLMRAVLSPAGGGGYDQTHEILAVVWAAVKKESGGAAALAVQRLERSRFRLTVRARPGLQQADRILMQESSLRVLAVDEHALAGRYLIFTAEEERGR